MDREFQRLEAVERFKEIDPEITKDLNDIVELAAQICNAPVALVTLLDADTQWFKIAKGTDVTQTPRAISFCNYTIQQSDVLVVPNMLNDERYNNNPMVTQAPSVRFYAGSPLTTKDGFSVGSLCVVDFEEKELSEQQKRTLKTLSKQVINLMELNWSLKVLEEKNAETQRQQAILEESEIKLKAVFDSSTDVHILVNNDLKIIAYNKPATAHIKSVYDKDVAIGDRIINFVDPKIRKHMVKYLDISLKGKVIKHDLQMHVGTEHESWREIKMVPVRNNNGKVIAIAINSADISKRKQQEKKINIQNEALTRIAIIQSHELRRPVASLIGMLSLLKIEEINFDYLDKMQLTITELDEKIRTIVKDSEDTINNDRLAIVA